MELKIRRMPPPPAPASRPMLRQERPEPGPHHNPPAATPQTASNETAEHALNVARNPGNIDSRKQRF
jgi:hypothetical protein